MTIGTRTWVATAATGTVLAAVLGWAAADATQAEQVSGPGDLYVRTELYFGAAKPDGSEVTEAEFDEFVDTIVTPRFPDGLTWFTADGQYLGSTGPIEETSYVLVLLYPVHDRQANGEVEEIRTEYEERFEQEAVLRADSHDRVSF